MNLFVFCLLLSAAAHSSPIIYIIHKNMFNPVKLFSTGIIATEKYILTTKYPFADYVRSELCALGVSNLETVQKPYMEQYCIGVLNVHYTNSGLALIELEKPLTFHYNLDAAQIPAVIDREAENLTRNCKMIYNERNSEGVVNKQSFVFAEVGLVNTTTPPEEAVSSTTTEEVIGKGPFEPSNLETSTPLIERIGEEVESLENDTGITRYYEKLVVEKVGNRKLEVNLNVSYQFCVHDNGLPLICEDAVLGVFSFKGEGGGQCCVNDCQEMETVEVIKLYSREVQEFLRKFMFVE